MSTVAETFLRRPYGVLEYVADAVRVVAALSVVVAGIGWGVVEIAVLARARAQPGPAGSKTGACRRQGSRRSSSAASQSSRVSAPGGPTNWTASGVPDAR